MSLTVDLDLWGGAYRVQSLYAGVAVQPDAVVTWSGHELLGPEHRRVADDPEAASTNHLPVSAHLERVADLLQAERYLDFRRRVSAAHDAHQRRSVVLDKRYAPLGLHVLQVTWVAGETVLVYGHCQDWCWGEKEIGLNGITYTSRVVYGALGRNER